MVWVRTIEGTTLAIFADPRYPEEHFAVWDFGPISAVPCNAYALGSRARVSGAIVHSRFAEGVSPARAVARSALQRLF
jgi:hypothetical protein